jgi:hypothetical protein
MKTADLGTTDLERLAMRTARRHLARCRTGALNHPDLDEISTSITRPKP